MGHANRRDMEHQHSDIIIVLEKGEIVEQGSHVELIKKAGHYSKFIKLQNLS